MNRVIKFRAWDGLSIRYDVTGFEHGYGNEMAGVFLDGNYYGIKGANDSLPIAEVMQFTGLLDSEGTEIYEGDIVSYEDISGSGRPRKFRPRLIKWDEECCGFNVSRHNKESSLLVLGNLHQHPELLETES